MKFLFIFFLSVLAVSRSFMLKSAPRVSRCALMHLSATAKIDILSREIELTDPLKLRVDSKIGKVTIISWRLLLHQNHKWYLYLKCVNVIW